MLNFKFKSKLYSTKQLLKEVPIGLSTLDFYKTQWRRSGNDCWEMGMRLIGKNAFWDPIIFTKWLADHKLKNKPTDLMQQDENKTLVAFVTRNTTLTK